MQMPVDIKAALEEVVDVEAARQQPISVTVYIDETAPGDLQAFVRQQFASSSETARVSILYLDGRKVEPYSGDDMACVVAGLSENVGEVAARIRRAGVPCMVATMLPNLVAEIAKAGKNEIPEADIVAPKLTKKVYEHVAAGGSNAPVMPASWGDPEVPTDGDLGQFEPIDLIDEARDTLGKRMGAWVAETCKGKCLAFAWCFPFVRHPLALEIVRATSVQNVGVGLLVFIPGADMPVMTLNQVKMLLQIAAAYGESLDKDRIKEVIVVILGAFGCRGVARRVASAVPVIGLPVKLGIGYGGTMAMGRAAIEYYEGGPTVQKATDAAAEMRDSAMKAAAKAAASTTRNAGVSAASSVRDAGASAVNSVRNAVTGAVSDAADGIRARFTRKSASSDAVGEAELISVEDVK